jgi:hypothetical protein
MSALICTDIIVGVCTSLVLVRRAVNPNCSQQTCPHPACLLNVIPTREEPGLLGWVSDLAKKKKADKKKETQQIFSKRIPIPHLFHYSSEIQI